MSIYFYPETPISETKRDSYQTIEDQSLKVNNITNFEMNVFKFLDYIEGRFHTKVLYKCITVNQINIEVFTNLILVL